MRLLQLDLERYGPFTGRSLALRPDAKLHVVYGANEAGKSCALAAITDLLFGIEARTSYDFLHDGRDMRIGARIVARDGRVLHVRRRKGNKNTLIDDADAPLADDTLLPVLGGLTREIFVRAFGLNAANLRAGAQDMLTSEGDVGASLFAAASGLRGLTELRRQLDKEAADIFAPRHSKERAFYQALDRFDAARKAMRERELRANDWRELNERIDRLAHDLEEVQGRRAAALVAQARLERLKRVAPVLRAIDDDLDRLAGFSDLPDPAPDYAARLRACLNGVASAKAACDAAAAAAARAGDEWSAIAVDADLIARADDIQALVESSGKFAKDRQDLPRIQAEADDYLSELGRLAKRLGLADAQAVEMAQPGDAALALARALGAERRGLADDRGRIRDNLRSEREGLADLDRQRAARGALSDPSVWRERFAALGPALQRRETRADRAAVLEGEARELAEAAKRLRPAADLDVLAAAALPDAAAIAKFRQQFEALDRDVARESEMIASAEQDAAKIAAKLRAFAAGRPLANPEAVAAARASRDADWAVLRAALFHEPGAPEGAALASAVAHFERDAAQADRLADDAVADANRIAEHDAEQQRRKDEQDKAEAARGRLAALQERRAAVIEDWRALWSGLDPALPTDMAQWLKDVAALLERRRRSMAGRDELAALDEKIGAAIPELRTLARDLGLPDAGDIGVLVEHIAARLDALAKAWNDARDLDTRRRDASARIARLETAEAEAAEREAALATRWREAAAGIGLAATATPGEAEVALQAWGEAPGLLHERDNRARRVDGLKRDIAAFETRARDLVARLAPDLAPLPPDGAAKALARKLTEAQTAQARKSEASRRREEAVRALADAEAALQRAGAALQDHAAALPENADLEALATRLAERDALRAVLAAERQQLVNVADGHAEAALRGDLADFDPDRAGAEIVALKQQVESFNEDDRRTYADHRKAVEERDAKEQGVGAEIAAQQKRGAEAELAELARDWAVTRLASLLIARAVERHRARQNDPAMARAGALFATLTENSFAGVAQDFGDDDQPRLVGRRGNGELVSIEGMSEATRDQLYLALRLAYLEDYAGHAEPAPFVLDDIFASFDEPRTARGLKALAEIGAAIQPIVFTHHRHVADIAAKLDADVIALT